MPRSSPRSLRSAAIAVGVTGALSILIPVGLVPGTGSLAPSALVRQQPTVNAALLSCDSGQPITRLVLAAGQCALVQAAGFDRDEPVQVRELDQPGWSQQLRAGPTGRLSYRFQSDRRAKSGPDLLTFIGQPATTGAPAAGTEVAASLPQIALCRFAIAGR